jgi:hypothetical protein
VSELVILTIPMEGTTLQTSSATSTSSSVGAPNVVPFRAAKSGVGYTTLIRMIVRAYLNNPLTY